MKKNNVKIISGLIVSLVITFIVIVFLPDRSRAQYPLTYYDVRLYTQDGNLLGEWKSKDVGRVDGNTLMFLVNDTGLDRSIRICGNYTVEEMK